MLLADAERNLNTVVPNHASKKIKANWHDRFISITRILSVITITLLMLKEYALNLVQLFLSKSFALDQRGN